MGDAHLRVSAARPMTRSTVATATIVVGSRAQEARVLTSVTISSGRESRDAAVCGEVLAG
ncbi:hypothetical protein BG418_01550 [Streptomyces sp. CBMA152]|nr:hypothetical protein [Streptomyces sp. CBMA152]